MFQYVIRPSILMMMKKSFQCYYVQYLSGSRQHNDLLAFYFLLNGPKRFSNRIERVLLTGTCLYALYSFASAACV